MDLQSLQEKHADLFAQVKALGKGEATLEELLQQQPQAAEQLRAEGRDAERARVVEILEADGDQAETLGAIKDGTPAAEIYKRLFAAEKGKRIEALKKLEEEAPSALGQQPPKAPPAGDGRPDEVLAAKARERAKEKGIKLDVAMMEIAAENPELMAQWNPAAELH